MKLWRTSTFQLTVLYAVMLAVSTVVVGYFLYWGTIGFLQRQTDATIEVEITGLREQYRAGGLNRLAGVIGDRIRSGDDPDAIYLFADRQLNPLAGNMSAWPDLISRADGWHSFVKSDNGRNVPARARVLALPEGPVLLVGRDISDLDSILKRSVNALAWGAGLTIALALMGGIFMSRQALRRVEGINETTRRIVTGDLGQRIETRGSGDEFDQLAGNVNRMLDQIEQLMGGVRHVGDSIAHDLRTPLTRMRHSLEEAAASKDIEAMRERVTIAMEDADGLLQTFAALLRIARLESGSYQTRTASIDLATLVDDAVELYEVVASERNIDVEIGAQKDCTVDGDRDLIFQALVNLIDNALKYTQEGGKVTISTACDSLSARLVVEDTGSGIPEMELEKVTSRFYRVDNSRGTPGSGLGLSLVKAVADIHGATLRIENLSPGVRVSIAFPGSDHPSAMTR